MKRFRFWIITGVLLVFIGIFYSITSTQGRMHLETLTIESKSGGRHIFQVEIADSPAEQERGLMFRTEMAPGHGMLFEMKRTDILKFWMKNTLIPLDILFISAEGEIKKIHHDAVPHSLQSISSEVPVQAALELNAGQAKALGIAEGDRVIHPYFKN